MAINLLKLGEALFGGDNVISNNLSGVQNKILKSIILDDGTKNPMDGITEIDMMMSLFDIFR